jgi:hypothetical protein
MSYPLLITKADFPEYTLVSLNVADRLINPYIGDAWTYFIEPLLRESEVAALGLPTADWAPGLTALWALLKPVWVLESYRRFIGNHGIHIAPSGVETLASDINRVPISGTERARLGAEAQAKLSIRLGKLEAALRTYRGTVPGTCHAPRRRTTPGGPTFYSA